MTPPTQPNRLRRWFSLWSSVAGVLQALAGSGATNGLEEMKAVVRSRFPDVPQLQPADLAAWLADTNRVRPILIDVRTEPEYRISHLPGAIRVSPSARVQELEPYIANSRPLVVYCSVGYRSSELATRLRKAGQTNVLNLEGSIFAWANENRPLITEGDKPTLVVHPYNQTFGKLLNKDRWPTTWAPPR